MRFIQVGILWVIIALGVMLIGGLGRMPFALACGGSLVLASGTALVILIHGEGPAKAQ